MCAAPALGTYDKPEEEWAKLDPHSKALLAWEADSSPRLQSSDLSDPEGFYRRLEDWLMKQK